MVEYKTHNPQFKPGDLAPRPPKPRSETEIIAQWKGDIEKPLVSIVCHTYNHELFIEDALNGFLMQETDFPFEIIIHDDASNDGTGKIVKDYYSNYPTLIRPILQKENQWSKNVMPRSYTFPKVRGEYIALCEGDDYWISSEKLKKQIDEFEPGIALVFHDAIRIEGGVIIEKSYYSSSTIPIDGHTSHQMVRGSKTPTASALFISRPFKNKEQVNIINGDHFVWATLAHFGSAKFIAKPWSVYRQHSGGVWSARLTADKVQPAIESKKVIFNSVASKFKTQAMLGFFSTCIELMNASLAEKDRTSSNYIFNNLILFFIRNVAKLRLSSLQNLKDLWFLCKLFCYWVPFYLIRIKIN